MKKLVIAPIACLILSACSGGVPEMTHEARTEAQRLVFDFRAFEGALSDLRIVLHNVDGSEVEQDIELKATDGVADFGALDHGSATVSFVSDKGPFGLHVTSVWDVPVRSYRPQPRAIDCDELVEVDVAVDASASDGGAADGAGVSAFGYAAYTRGSGESRSVWSFENLSACSDSPARIFAGTYQNGSPNLYSLDSFPGLEDGGHFTVAPDQPVSTTNWITGNATPDLVEVETWIDGQPLGMFDTLRPANPGDLFHGAFDAPGAAILTAGYRDSDDGSTRSFRSLALRPPSEEVSLDLWDVVLTPGSYDAERSAQDFSYTADSPAQVAVASYFSALNAEEGDGSQVVLWFIHSDPIHGEIVAPVMPDDLESRMQRESHTAFDSLSIQRYDAFRGYADWVDHYIDSATPYWELDQSIATQPPRLSESGQFNDDCIRLLLNISICLSSPSAEARSASRRPWEQRMTGGAGWGTSVKDFKLKKRLN